MGDTPSEYMSEELREIIRLDPDSSVSAGLKCVFYTRRKDGAWIDSPQLEADIDSIEQSVDTAGHKWTTTRFNLTPEKALAFLDNLPKLVHITLGTKPFMKVMVTDQLLNVVSDRHSGGEVEIGFSFR